MNNSDSTEYKNEATERFLLISPEAASDWDALSIELKKEVAEKFAGNIRSISNGYAQHDPLKYFLAENGIAYTVTLVGTPSAHSFYYLLTNIKSEPLQENDTL